MSKKITLVIKSPESYTEDEFNQIFALIQSGNEVGGRRLKNRIRNSNTLITLYEDDVFVGVSALKYPESSYRKRIESETGISLTVDEFPFELGYIVVSEESRGKGYSNYLVAAALSAREDNGVFATARVSNLPMQKTLPKFGFQKSGKTYPSERRKEDIQLFLSNP